MAKNVKTPKTDSNEPPKTQKTPVAKAAPAEKTATPKAAPSPKAGRRKTVATSNASATNATNISAPSTKATDKKTADPVTKPEKTTAPKSEPQTPDTSPQTAPKPQAAQKKEKSRVLPFLLGGVVVLGLGYGALQIDSLRTQLGQYLPMSQASTDTIETLKTQLATSQNQLSDAQEKINALGDKLDQLQAQFDAMESSVKTQNTALHSQIDALAKRPNTSGGTGKDHSDEIQALQMTIESQNQQIATLSETLNGLQTAAATQDATLQNTAQHTMKRAAQSLISAALESGASFDASLADLETLGVENVPQILKDVSENGVETLSELQNSIANAARAALAATPVDTQEGVWGFVKHQLSVRSTEPRAGDDVDSILSRVEGAMRAGDLDTALKEAQNLPQEAQNAMQDWLEKSATRQAAIRASQDLMRSLAAE